MRRHCRSERLFRNTEQELFINNTAEYIFILVCKTFFFSKIWLIRLRLFKKVAYQVIVMAGYLDSLIVTSYGIAKLILDVGFEVK